MSKTPEELAEEYTNQFSWNDPREEDAQDAFVAGYKAAKEEDTCEHILDMSKMVDVNGWISVKDRLPEEESGLLLVYNSRLKKIGTSYWSEGIWCGGTWPVTSQFITYWMPIPEPPKEGK
jgi:hypothetical protein